MKPKVLVTRGVFDEVLTFLDGSLDVESNQNDVPFERPSDPPHRALRKICGGALLLSTLRVLPLRRRTSALTGLLGVTSIRW